MSPFSLPEISDRYWKLIQIILVLMTILTGMSIVMDNMQTNNIRNHTLQMEMAKRHYCLSAVTGSDKPQYQPCGCYVKADQ